jgi:hypothetical protein
MVDGLGIGGIFPRPLATYDNRHAADPDIELRRTAEIFLQGGDLAPEHLPIPVRRCFRIAADQMNVVERH